MNNVNYPSRRFLRIELLNNLYIYDISRQINYQESIEQINLDFLPNSMAEITENKTQLKTEATESINLFKEIVNNEKKKTTLTHSNTRILTSVNTAYCTYKTKTEISYNNIKKHLSETEHNINEAILLLLQLLIEWQKILSKKNLTSHKDTATNTLAQKLQYDSTLKKLSSDPYFQENIKKYSINWQKENYQIEDWLSTVYLTQKKNLKKNPHPDNPKFIYSLISDILLKSPLIIDFFEKKYIHWHRSNHMVKNILKNILYKYIVDTEKKSIFSQEYLFVLNTSSLEFYKKLLDTFLEKEPEINEYLKNNLKNWDLNRMVLIDKIIAKLALCEILYFIEIPRTVSINEYVEIAKIYGTEQSDRFINGILDFSTINK